MDNYQDNQNFNEQNAYVKKRTGTLSLFTFLLALTLFFTLGSVIMLCRKGSYSSSGMNKLLEKHYSEIYGDSKSSGKENALVAIVVYPDGKKYDCRCKNSGNLEMLSGYRFDEKYCTIDNYLDDHTPDSGYKNNLVKYLTDTFNYFNGNFSYYTKRYSGSNTQVINNTGIDYSGIASLKNALSIYHSYTNCNVSIVIEKNDNVYGVNFFLFFLFLIPAIGCGIGSFATYSMYAKENRELIEYEDNGNNFYSNVQTSSSSDLNSNSNPFEKFDSDKDPFEEYSKNDQDKQNY